MRTITSATQTKLETDLGVEVLVVLEIFWASEDGTATGPSEFYADKEITGTQVKGKILTMSAFDEAVQVTGGGQAASFSVTLDDTDGAIKAIFDANDVHKTPVKVWLYVTGTDFDTDKVAIFQGQVNSPVTWREGERTFDISVVNRIEDVEVGFSAEEGEFPALPEDLIGKTWPLCFGTTINVPALKAVPAISGQLAGGVGISDFTLPSRIALAEAITCPQTPIGFKCNTSFVGGGTYKATCNIAFETDNGCLQARCVEIERLKLQLEEQKSYEYPQITVFGGKQFPQGRVITININGGLFTGFFDGTLSNPSNVFKIQSRRHPDYDPATGTVIADELEAQIKSACPGEEDAQDSDFTDTAFGPVFTGLRSSRISWETYRNAKQATFFWAGGGSTVTLQTSKEIVYIANIVPSTILRVAAWRTINGNRFLLTVPSQFYEIRQVDYGGYNVMEVVFQRPLSAEQQNTGGGWTDDIFITQISSVGPNTVDILEWFIDTYTSYAKDSTSFASVKTAIDNYPMHFALLDRPNLLAILQDLAQKARCALWQKLDTFYIKYLSEEPSSVATIAEDDVLADDTGKGSLEISLTKTEDLVTKLVCKWRKDYSLGKDNTLILRHNVIKYGTHDKTEDYFPFGHLDIVRKSATFWLIRWANTWKRVKLSVSLEFLKLEPFDCVTLNLPDVAPAPFKAIVEKATLDTEGKQINLELWTPIRAGESTPYDFAWPAQIAEKALFPTIEAKNAGQAGSGKEPNFSTIAPPGHPLRNTDPGVVGGFSLGCNGAGVTSLKPGECRQDNGDRLPSDIGDQKPTVDVAADTTGNISGGTSPVTNGAGYNFWSHWQIANDWTKKVEGDAGRGRETGAIIDDDTGSTDQTTDQTVDRDFLDNLPDPDDLTTCHYKVYVSGFGLTESGTKPICLPQAIREEVYAFDSAGAANQFCAELSATKNCGSNPPCTQCTICRVAGPFNDSNGDGCADGEGNLVGFRGAPSHPNTSFMQGSK